MTILISIDRAQERQKRIRSQNIEFTIVKHPVDGHKLADPKSYLSPRAFYDFDKKRVDHRTINTLGAIGCYLSHRNAWKEIIDKNKPDLIIEDDITVENKNYKTFTDCWISSNHSKPRILWLQCGYLNKNPNLYWGSGAYLINPMAASILFQHSIPIDIQVDSFMHLIIHKFNWDLEISNNIYFSQYETTCGPFKSLCQKTNTTDDKTNHYFIKEYVK